VREKGEGVRKEELEEKSRERRRGRKRGRWRLGKGSRGYALTQISQLFLGLLA